MPVLLVRSPRGDQKIVFEEGLPLHKVLEAHDVQLRIGCRGTGACGLCRVRILRGDAGEPTLNEGLHLSEAELASGVRLACQILLQGDLEIAIPGNERKRVWHILPVSSGELEHLPGKTTKRDAPQNNEDTGVAVDLGTTHIRISMLGLSSGEPLASGYARNPQSIFGADVITRLLAAAESEKNLKTMGRLVFESIGKALGEMELRYGISPERVRRMCMVGNTAMLALLSGINPQKLLQPASWNKPMECPLGESREWIRTMGIHPEAHVEIIPPLAGFVGSDLLAGVLAADLTVGDATTLFIDFGTNSEIALWSRGKLWITSAAGGPAFEGSGISCGLPAEPGAVYRVRRKGGNLVPHVLGGGTPQGLCGSGLVDLTTELLRSGLLDEKGRFASSIGKEGFRLPFPGKPMVLTRSDVDLLQRAKGAIGAGIKILAVTAGVSGKEIEHLRITGAFGGWLHVENAQSMGLLPRLSASVELLEGAALKGCERILLSPEASQHTAWIRERMQMLNLSQHPDFEDAYLEHLYLRPGEVC